MTALLALFIKLAAPAAATAATALAAFLARKFHVSTKGELADQARRAVRIAVETAFDYVEQTVRKTMSRKLSESDVKLLCETAIAQVRRVLDVKALERFAKLCGIADIEAWLRQQVEQTCLARRSSHVESP